VGGDERTRRAPQPQREALELRPAAGEPDRDRVRPALGVHHGLVDRLVAEGRRSEGEVRQPERKRWQREQEQLDAGRPLPLGPVGTALYRPWLRSPSRERGRTSRVGQLPSVGRSASEGPEWSWRRSRYFFAARSTRSDAAAMAR